MLQQKRGQLGWKCGVVVVWLTLCIHPLHGSLQSCQHNNNRSTPGERGGGVEGWGGGWGGREGYYSSGGFRWGEMVGWLSFGLLCVCLFTGCAQLPTQH